MAPIIPDLENSESDAAVRRLVHASVVYMVWASIGGIVAIVQNRPAGFAGQASGLTVWKDFVFGLGTALSPTLWWLAIQLLFTRWVSRPGTLRRAGVYGLMFFGLGEFVGALGEPITYAVLRPATFDPFLAVIQSGLIILPAAMMVFGLLAARET